MPSPHGDDALGNPLLYDDYASKNDDLPCSLPRRISFTSSAPSTAGLVFGIPRDDAAWLLVFCVTGVGLGMAFEFLDLYSIDSTPAAGETFFLCFIGYWAQTIFGGAYAFTVDKPFRGAWTKKVVKLLVISALFDGGAQALDYIGQVRLRIRR